MASPPLPPSDEETVLYCNVGCPFARRAMLTVHEKALSCTFAPIPLSGQLKKMKADGVASYPQAAELWPGATLAEIMQCKEDYKRDINSTGEVPTLRLGTDVVTEADVVSEFLEDAFPTLGASLMPINDPVGRSRVRHGIKVLNGSDGVSAMYGCLMNQDPTKDEAARTRLYKGLAKFVSLASEEGPYFLGEQFSLADLMLLPMWDQFRFILPHYRGVELVPASEEHAWAPRMRQWAAAVEQRESFKAHRMTEEQYVAAYVGYAGARGASEFGN